ncbi:SDR family NAD(P)-dependent oxidoreductase [Hephaestia sp. GCM10023244]|uniref:SDR family NAD(P)-dependent oxidoreductase n=1 Tax=unclassified Hephaestia TaxID=2631281 RepID=UPI00207714D6|nr:SDR family NAD(P)-dependent oxidoreductase [Hephaestia sp. MAHUQ-44]MCM8731606.1 SDR family oxidoreductase [Hephaestia sp. MAHUQ-44]
MRLKDKRIMVTGAASGIGRACARLMAKQGARVIGADIDAQGLETLNRCDDPVATIRMDVATEADWARTVAFASDALGGLDAIVHSAGIGIGGDLTTLSLERWRYQQAVNLDSAFLAIKYTLPPLREAGGGSIIFIASVTGVRGSAIFAPYAASKAGVIALMRSAARASALAGDGVRVNAIAPGVIDTPIFERMEGVDAVAADPRATARQLVPLGRPGQAEDIAHAAIYLASNEANYITGIVLPVDGGLSMS